MKKNLLYGLPAIFLGLMTLSLGGCGDEFGMAPVSGTVTIGGQPAEGVEVFFEPMPVEGNSNTGPFSSGVTDATGKYTLEDRYGNPGAVVGEHRVYFETVGYDPEAADAAASEMMEAGESGEDVSDDTKSAFNAARQQKTVPREYGEEESTMKAEVPPGGTTEANFDL